MSEWIDISRPIRPDMVVWPGDGPPLVEQINALERGDTYNLTRLAFSAHTGTHMDAPRHFLPDGAPMDALPLDAVLGPARVVEILDPIAVHAAGLPGDLDAGERVLFKTRNSTQSRGFERFDEDFVYIARDAAAALATARAACVGIDALSVGGFHNDLLETHQILLGAGVWIIEGLDLRRVQPGRYELACLPLLIPGADGAPARAALRPL
jgi:arylformamidase